MCIGILFDLDGTLVDTFLDLLEATNYALEKTNNPKVPPQELKNFIGKGVLHLVDSALGQTNHPSRESARKYFLNHYLSHSTYNSRPYDGIIPLLNNLKADNYKLAVVTNKRHSAATHMIEYFFPGIFDYVQGESEDIPRKPAPDMINRTLEVLKLEKNKVIFVGDSSIDFMTYTSANIVGITCLYGFTKREELLNLAPKYTVEHPNQLYPLIKKISSKL